MDEFEAAIQDPDGINPETGKHFSEYMDVELWAQKFLIEEGFQNPDSGGASVYFYKDTDTKDPRLKAGPVWDYDRAMGAYLFGNFSSLDDPKQLSYYCLYSKQMMEFEEVRAIVRDLLQSWFAPYVENEFASDVSYWEDYIDASSQMDSVRWPVRGDLYVTKNANYEYLSEFMQTRIAFLKDAFAEDAVYHRVVFHTVDGSPDYLYTIPHGGYMPDPAPVVASYEDIFAGWKNVETGITYDSRMPILEDAVYEAKWIPARLIVINGLSQAEFDLNDVDVVGLQVMVDTIREMQEAERESQ